MQSVKICYFLHFFTTLLLKGVFQHFLGPNRISPYLQAGQAVEAKWQFIDYWNILIFFIFEGILIKIKLSHCTDTVFFSSFFSHYRLSDCTRSKIVIFQPIYPIFFNVGRDLSFKGAKICQATPTAAGCYRHFPDGYWNRTYKSQFKV